MKRHWTSILLVLCILSGCTAPASKQPQTKSIFAMDTFMDFTIYGDASLLTDVEKLICDLEKKVSVTDEASELYAINQTGTGILTGSAADLMQSALAICTRTDGALDISIYPIVRAWGFTTGEYQVPDTDALQELLTYVDYTKIKYDRETGNVSIPYGMKIDLGSVAKGYVGSQAAQYLRENGVNSALLNLGGNIQTIGCKPDGTPWKIAIKDPSGDTPIIVLSVQDQAIVTSGGYERYFELEGNTYWHIMDPTTGRPAENGLLSVTIIGNDGAVCDGLSTALFVMGLEKAVALWQESDNFEAVFITAEKDIYITEGLMASFSLTEDHQDTVVRVIERQTK